MSAWIEYLDHLVRYLLSDEHIYNIYERFFKRSSSYLRGEINHRLDAEGVCE